LADDDPDDRELVIEALRDAKVSVEIQTVMDGEELTDYLFHRGSYADKKDLPTPSLILLDLNMPKKDGREVLQEIKRSPHLAKIPVVILSTSCSQDEIMRSYHLGANSFITKPITYRSLTRTMQTLIHYWFKVVQLPS
jgi:CheY-like chemotaxis protein